jgi:hypothetical protein
MQNWFDCKLCYLYNYALCCREPEPHRYVTLVPTSVDLKLSSTCTDLKKIMSLLLHLTFKKNLTFTQDGTPYFLKFYLQYITQS